MPTGILPRARAALCCPRFVGKQGYIERLALTYHAWRGEKKAGEYADIPAFCKSATLEEIRKRTGTSSPPATT